MDFVLDKSYNVRFYLEHFSLDSERGSDSLWTLKIAVSGAREVRVFEPILGTWVQSPGPTLGKEWTNFHSCPLTSTPGLCVCVCVTKFDLKKIIVLIWILTFPFETFESMNLNISVQHLGQRVFLSPKTLSDMAARNPANVTSCVCLLYEKALLECWGDRKLLAVTEFPF